MLNLESTTILNYLQILFKADQQFGQESVTDIQTDSNIYNNWAYIKLSHICFFHIWINQSETVLDNW